MPVNCLFSGRTSKESESITDCQDYFAINEARGCFAIADGASQSFYPAIWAKVLVQHFCENPEISSVNWKTWLEPIQAQWLNEVKSRVEMAKSQGKPTWIEGYNGLSAQRSATSTFIGLRFNEDKIKACIVGDSCLFIYRNRNLESYPLTLKRSEDFNDRPEYLASHPKDNHFQPHFFDINLEQSDNAYIILATDALSEYILKCIEQKKPIFSPLRKISSQEQFEHFVASARHQTVRMKNDDVTLLLLTYNHSSLHNTSQALTNPVEVASGSSIVLSNQRHSETHQITGFTSDSNLLPPSQKVEQPAFNISQRNSKINHLKQQRSLLFILLFLSVTWNVKQYFDHPNFISKEHCQPVPSNQTNLRNQTKNTLAEPFESPTKAPEEKSATQSQPKTFELKAGTRIYRDENMTKPLILKSSSPIKVSITETTINSNKIEVILYAHSTTAVGQSCQGENITLTENIGYSLEHSNDTNLLGKLTEKSTFKNLDPQATNWCKIQFVGYVAK